LGSADFLDWLLKSSIRSSTPELTRHKTLHERSGMDRAVHVVNNAHRRKAGEIMSSRYIAKYALIAVLALLSARISTGEPVAVERAKSANDLVRAVVANELKTQDGKHTRWMYQAEKDERGTKKEKEVVQTEYGSLDRLLAVDGRSLTDKQQRAEQQRIERLAKNPAEFQQTKRRDADECRAFLKILADAFNFSYAGRDRDVIKLTFRPNPAFQAASSEARVLHEMEGQIWVHETQQRLVRIQGHLSADVKFAGGLLGHLEKGGYFDVQQHELSPGQWNLTFIEVNMKGKALCFKNVAIEEKEYRTDFRAVPDGLTLGQAAAILTNQIIVASTAMAP
jgi:hypothetical protein